ncbi:hypothetical protein QTP86_000921 [Hemibagrus guttatus]|nr:hypothetical protein QTP86_000921 [Hemibagrus guttatus]
MLFDFGGSVIPGAWEQRLRQKLSVRGDVFSTNEWDVGLAKGVEHQIRLQDNKPFRERSRRIAPADIEDVRRHIKELLTAGITKESRSPYASPIVVARKKTGAIRMCIDYRTLNARTIPDQCTTPRIDDALDCLVGSKWFSVLVLRSGYYQIAMAEEDKEKMAFICPLGFFQFERMPQGITGAPATFQRLMEKAVGDMHLLQVIVYLDDIIVFGRTLEEHEERLLKVLDRLRECGLKVSIDKCQFCQSQVRVRLTVPETSRKVTAPETRSGSVGRAKGKRLGGRTEALIEGEPRTDSENEEDDLWYYYPERVETQPRPESEAQDGFVVEENTVCHGDESDRSQTEVAKTAFTEESNGELEVRVLPSPEELIGPGLEGGEPSLDNATREMEAGLQKVLQVDLEVNGLVDPLGTRSVTWQVEYPMSRTFSEEIPTLIRLAAHDLGGIVPLAMETEILNTAVLTGRTVAMPIKVVTVATDGAVTDVTESVECRSTDDDVVKVSERCDYVYVNGKEMRGRVRMMLNFTYNYLSTQLEVSVWMPRLPLQIDMADPELNQIKGWRIPVSGGNPRSADDDEVDGSRRDRGCGPQYQSTTVRVLTHFEAEPLEGRDQPDFLLGSDWQVDVTELVKDLLKVEDSRVARITNGTTLTGLNTGTTKVQVMSPLSDSVLAERSVRIVDDKVSITDLGVQLVSGLSLSLQLSPGSNRAIAATATTQDTMHSPKQESLVSAWLHFSDGSVTSLDLYDPAHYILTATSLDERVVTVQRAVWWRSPVVVVKGEGQGTLLRIEMSGADLCQKSKRRNVMASVSTNVRVKFSRNDDGDNRRQRPSSPYNEDSISEAGMVNKGATTIKTGAPLGDKRPIGGIPADFSNFPAQAEPPHGRTTEEDLLQARRGLTDLEIGMYALLGVFCLAILVFLINCVSYALQYQNKQLPLEAQESMAHAHDWVWLGHEGELMENHGGLCLQQDELSATVDSSLGLEEASQLLNGVLGQKSAQGQGGREHKSETGNSPTTKRKRVKFTTFSHSKTGGDCQGNSPLGVGKNDIQWVCPDIKLGDSIELRNYMERLNENATKNAA